MRHVGACGGKTGVGCRRRVEAMRATTCVACGLAVSVLAVGAAKASAAPAAGAGHFDVTPIALPGAPADGVALDYLAIDRARHRLWVPAGGTGNAVVVDTNTQKVDRIENFPTAEVERRGTKRQVGLSSATIGDGFVYLGNRADSSVCAVDATSLARAGCVTLPSSPDGVAFVARTKEVWVTMPRVQTIQILDVSQPSAPKLSASIKLDGDPEGYAVDDARGAFYTNLEDKDRTLRIDLSTRKVMATWMPSCGEDGPRGLAIEPSGRFLMVACTQHVEVLATAKDGRILSKLDAGAGVDNLDFLPGPRLLYAAAGGAGTLTIAADAAGLRYILFPRSFRLVLRSHLKANPKNRYLFESRRCTPFTPRRVQQIVQGYRDRGRVHVVGTGHEQLRGGQAARLRSTGSPLAPPAPRAGNRAETL
jgi:DNA-binding beta-propeller fold protein YncE